MLATIAEMPEPDRTMGERLNTIIKATAPDLSPRLWYGMPGQKPGGRVSARPGHAPVWLQRCEDADAPGMHGRLTAARQREATPSDRRIPPRCGHPCAGDDGERLGHM